MTYRNLISADQLVQQLDDCRLFDCRAKLGDLSWGQAAFEAGHLPGAIHLDLDRDLAAAPGEHGRHPLPNKANWLATVRRLGVNNDDQVVVYDDASGAFAARAWWMFRWLGHENVAVLDGGLASWSDPLVVTAASYAISNYQPGSPLTQLLTTETVAQGGMTLIDARSEARWAGREEPIDPVAGHIPGATCFPFQGNLAADGRFLDPSELRERFVGIPEPRVCYCGSGVTAAHNILAMHVAGFSEPYLYADSFSGWITDPTRPVDQA